MAARLASMDGVERKDIEALRAASAGDAERIALCDRALAGDGPSWDACAELIRAQDDALDEAAKHSGVLAL